MRAIRCVLVLMGAPSTAAPATAQHGASRNLEDLQFMAGCWRGTFNRAGTPGVIEEHYTDASANVLLGTTRYLVGSRTIQYELTVIRGDSAGIRLVPYPGGRRSEHDFRLTESGNGRAVFEAPEHDYPRRITYRATGDSTLQARIDAGPQDDRPRTWTMRRSPCPGKGGP